MKEKCGVDGRRARAALRELFQDKFKGDVYQAREALEHISECGNCRAEIEDSILNNSNTVFKSEDLTAVNVSGVLRIAEDNAKKLRRK